MILQLTKGRGCGVLCLPGLKMQNTEINVNWRQSLRDVATVLQASVSQQGAVALCISPSHSSGPCRQPAAATLCPLSRRWLRAGGWHLGVLLAHPSLCCANADCSVLAWRKWLTWAPGGEQNVPFPI